MKLRILPAVLLTAALMAALSCEVEKPDEKAEMTPELWESDLLYMTAELEGRQPDIYRLVAEDVYKRAVATLLDSIPSWSGAKIAVEMARIAAMPGDRNTGLDLLQRELGFKRLPLRLEFFEHLLYVTDADEKYREAVGCVITGVGEKSAQSARFGIRTLIASDNDMQYMITVPLYMTCPEILHALGFASDDRHVTFKLEKPDGTQLDITFEAAPAGSFDTSRWISARDPGATGRPLYLEKGNGPRWHRYLEDAGVVYCRIDSFEPVPGGGDLLSFAVSLQRLLETGDVKRLVIDLRHNGSSYIEEASALAERISAIGTFGEKGMLVVILGRGTYSAGTVLAAKLRDSAGAVLAGENSSSRPNPPGGHGVIRLPNSLLELGFSLPAVTAAPELMDSPYLPLDIFAENSFGDYKSGRDSVLDAAVAWAPGAAGGMDSRFAGMALVPAGEFTMGKDGSWDRDPAHKVFIDSFYIDTHEVTNLEYYRFCMETGHPLPEFWGFERFHCGLEYPRHPVIGVTSYDARKYAEWAGKRLPTEAEWEYAARGGLEGEDFPTGGMIESTKANVRAGTVMKGTFPVGCFPPNGYGLHDMSGNAIEWVSDFYYRDYYARSPYKNPRCAEPGNFVVLRGGGWHSGAMCSSVSARNAVRAYWVDFCIGFRCVRDTD